ncbi:MAG: helix-turn-helix domain-containing protein [Clostridiales bacterium]|nr:helix-turn-helix domain-containing protein [Clostridiales bacterium]
MHYGVGKMDGAPGRGSGRYPLGSGENPNQHGSGTLLSRIKELEDQKDELVYVHPKTGKEYRGEQAIAKIIFGPDASTTQLRVERSIAVNEERSLKVAAARALRDQGLSLNEIAEKMGYANDSSVRSLLNDNAESRMLAAQTTADYLKKMVDEKGMIDVGKGVEGDLTNPVSRTKMEQALYLLEREGYKIYGGGVPQVTNKGQQTNLKVLCPPGTEHKEIYNFENIHSVKEYQDKILTDDGDAIRDSFYYPASMDSSRIKIRYAEEGGKDKDGVVEIRRGVQDLSLGDSHYAQVRILVDGTHYIKGMAVYSDDMPEGTDIIFNTNKSVGTPMCGPKDNTVLKNIGKDPENPFGSLIKTVEKGGQSFYDDPNGNYIDPVTGKKQSLSLINKRSDEGDWNDWSDHLPSQFLSKQPQKLIERQLYLTTSEKMAEHDEIMALTNPTIKKRLLRSFADDCDAAAVNLQATALPGQKYKVILPVPQMKDTEVYAPGYENGTKVALIRYPHGGTFEIPILTVNNKQEDARKLLGTTPKDAIGITAAVAERLSGADFDGDTVMVIPTGGKINIKSTPQLEGLKDFDPKVLYSTAGRPEGSFKVMKNTQTEMGKISNLITDMTLKGANSEELARAVRHSMVVIDAEKHRLDYKQSEKDNRIAELKKMYQGRIDEETGRERNGAATIISRAKGETSVIKRQGSPLINQKGKSWYDPTRPEGALVYKTVDNPTYIDKKTGKEKTRTQKSTQMADTDDARKLSSGHPVEELYSEYANNMKALANRSRMEMVNTPSLKYSPSAKIVYAKEVESLNSKLRVSEQNRPRERQAQIIATSRVNAAKQGFIDAGLTKKEVEKELKNLRQRELDSARRKVGAKRVPIIITDREWEAIQAGAITDSKLSKILDHTDIDKIRERATPRSYKQISQTKINRINALKAQGYTTDEIAKAIGVSASTVTKYL